MNEVLLLCIFMKFLIKFQKTALNIAVENGDSEIVQLLLSNEKTDLNSVDTIFLFH